MTTMRWSSGIAVASARSTVIFRGGATTHVEHLPAANLRGKKVRERQVDVPRAIRSSTV